MSYSSDNSNEYFNQDIETKRRQNIEDNLRFLAALKINDIRDEIKDIENVHSGGRIAAKKETQSDVIRRSSRIRKNFIQVGDISPVEEKRKKKVTKTTDENQAPLPPPKLKLQLPEHMLIRYHSNGKKVALHNTKEKFGDESTLL